MSHNLELAETLSKPKARVRGIVNKEWLDGDVIASFHSHDDQEKPTEIVGITQPHKKVKFCNPPASIIPPHDKGALNLISTRQESLVKGQVDIQSNDESAFTNPFWAKKQAKLLESKQWHEPLENCIQLAYSLWIDPNDDACSVLNCVEANKEPTDDTEAPDDFTMFSQSLRVLYRS